MQPQHGFVGTPAALVAFHVRQIAIVHEFLQRRCRAQFPPLLLRIVADQRLREHEPRLAPRLIERQHIRGAELELPLASAAVGIALIECLAARGADLEHESALIDVEEVDLRTARRTGCCSCEVTRELDFRHYTDTFADTLHTSPIY